MHDAKPFASLTSSLLARKGAARPAMRPQLIDRNGNAASLEDLGWNDMGGEDEVDAGLPEHFPSPIGALTPAPRQSIRQPEGSPVLQQRRAIEAQFAEEQVPEAEVFEPLPEIGHDEIEAGIEPESLPAGPAEVVELPPRLTEPMLAAGKAAFTLRLDEQRHLRLRLATAVQNRSAQRIVTEALDTYLQSLPELDPLVEQVPARSRKRG